MALVQLLAVLTVGGGRCRVNGLYRLDERWSVSNPLARNGEENRWRSVEKKIIFVMSYPRM